MKTLASLVQPKFEFYIKSFSFPKKTDTFEYDEVRKAYFRIAPKPELPTKEEWYECKKYVSNLPSDYIALIADKAKKNMVVKDIKNKGYELTYEHVIGKFKVELNLFETFVGEIKIARYLAYNHHKNVVFARNLLKKDLLAQF